MMKNKIKNKKKLSRDRREIGYSLIFRPIVKSLRKYTYIPELYALPGMSFPKLFMERCLINNSFM